MALFGRGNAQGSKKRQAADARRSAGIGRSFRTGASVEQCKDILTRALTWWQPPYPNMPAFTPAGVAWTGSGPEPLLNIAFEMHDSSPGLMAIWADGQARLIAVFAPGSETSAAQVERVHSSWRAVDPHCQDLGQFDGHDLRYVAPPVPPELPRMMLEWGGLPVTQENLSAAASLLGMQIALKARQFDLGECRAANPPGTFGRVLEETEHLSMRNPQATPFVQQIPWRMATLCAKSFREMSSAGKPPAGFHL